MRRALGVLGAVGLLLAVFAQVDVPPGRLADALILSSTAVLVLVGHPSASHAAELSAFGVDGAAAYQASRPVLPLVASALLLTFVFGTRATRSRSWRELAFHLGMAFAAGAAAACVSRTETPAQVALWLLALTSAAVLAGIPWLVPHDSWRSLALRRLAACARGPLRWRLLRAVVVVRRARSTPRR
jgi:hypothetical protein